MEITIQQNAFSWCSEYEITAPAATYTAKKKFWSFGDKLQLLGPRERLLARVRSRWRVLTSRYDFELVDGATYHFRTESFWKSVFVCEGNAETFRLYQHKGLNFSIFQNEAQIAAFTKDRVSIGNGDTYSLKMNDDANLVVILCMVLTIDLSESEGNGSSVTIDFGNIGPEARPFDRNWTPS